MPVTTKKGNYQHREGNTLIEESRLEPDQEPPLLPGMAETEVTMNALVCDVYVAIHSAFKTVQRAELDGFVEVVAAHLWQRGWTLPWPDDE